LAWREICIFSGMILNALIFMTISTSVVQAETYPKFPFLNDNSCLSMLSSILSAAEVGDTAKSDSTNFITFSTIDLNLRQFMDQLRLDNSKNEILEIQQAGAKKVDHNPVENLKVSRSGQFLAITFKDVYFTNSRYAPGTVFVAKIDIELRRLVLIATINLPSNAGAGNFEFSKLDNKLAIIDSNSTVSDFKLYDVENNKLLKSNDIVLSDHFGKEFSTLTSVSAGTTDLNNKIENLNKKVKVQSDTDKEGYFYITGDQPRQQAYITSPSGDSIKLFEGQFRRVEFGTGFWLGITEADAEASLIIQQFPKPLIILD